MQLMMTMDLSVGLRNEERAKLAKWTDEVKLCQLIFHLVKTADQVFRALSAEQKLIYFAAVTALKKRFRPITIEELRGWDFHRRVQGDDILYFNVRSLLPKLDDLRIICSLHSPDIVCITESWLDGSMLKFLFRATLLTALIVTDMVVDFNLC